jgi:methyltransferase FkbM-like protein
MKGRSADAHGRRARHASATVAPSASPSLPGVRFSPAERRACLLAAHGVDLVIDVGANRGQYASGLRAAGVPVDRLDGVWSAFARDAQRPYLKMDTQGSELDVLRGTIGALDAISLVEVELSLLAVYDSAPVFQDVYALLAQKGFAPIAFEGVLDDPETGEMLQADGIFRRRDTIEPGLT